MLPNQKDKFSLDADVTWLNGSYMSPQLKSVEEIGIQSLKRKSKPWTIPPSDFFSEQTKLKSLFARLINIIDIDRVAVIPSVSYGIANVATNIDFQPGDEIILVDQLFPSNYFIWKKIADDKQLKLTLVSPSTSLDHRGKKWNEALLNAINHKTKVVSMEHCHWTDGTLFDLSAIRQKTFECGALVIIDGTQSIGAFPFDQNIYQVDALVAAGYKWLMGPYSIGLAYYGPAFDNGLPIEHNWINKKNSEIFEKLTDYEEAFKPGAARYNMGEQSQFINAPMLSTSMEQLLDWGVPDIQAYCCALVDEVIPLLKDKNIWIEDKMNRSSHLFGLRPPRGIQQDLKKRLSDHKVYVSYRGESIRVSVNVYNTVEDLLLLIDLM